MNAYIGESERNVRMVFEEAKRNRPCVVFFDELDSIAGKKDSGGSGGGGVTERVVSQFLTELDGCHENTVDEDGEEQGMIFVVGATNRPDLIDTAFLRPGRFDRMIYLAPPQERGEKLTLIKAVTRQIPLVEGMLWDNVLDVICKGKDWTGADYRAFSVNACMKAMGRVASKLEEAVAENSSWTCVDDSIFVPDPITPSFYLDHICKDPQEYLNFHVTEQDFIEAAQELKPSVSAKEMQRYEALQNQFQ